MRIKTLVNLVQSKIAALRYPYYRIKAKVNQSSPRIKIVAIAKNESAYLPEWIYHHLFFGFDHICVYFNGCTDNTEKLIETIEDKRITFINADSIFKQSEISPQMDIYRPEFAMSRNEGYDHVMFLDIDEFWVPFDLSTSIKEHIKRSPYFDSMSFQWANKVDESKQFSRAISPCIRVEPARQLKSIHKSFITPGLMNPHNVVDSALIRRFADGSPFVPSNKHHSIAEKATLSTHAFILHRKYRSQLEYVALLGRGRPIGPAKVVSGFKNNREGYYVHKTSQEVAFSNQAYQVYNQYMKSELDRFEKSGILTESKRLVTERYQEVIQAIKVAPPEELPILTKILRHVEIDDVQQALASFKQRIR